MPMTTSYAGFELVTSEHGRVDFRPFAPSNILRELVPLVSATMWPRSGASGRLLQDTDLWADLCYWHVVRGVSLLTLMSTATEPAGQVLDDLRKIPAIRYDSDGELDEQYVPTEYQAHRLDTAVVPGCPEPVRELLRGRIEYALRQWPTAQAEVFAELAGGAAPLPVDDQVENSGNRWYGAQVGTALFATFLGVPELRWPLAAAWATNHLLRSWLSWVDSTPQEARQCTAGLAPYGSSDPKRYDAPQPDWAGGLIG